MTLAIAAAVALHTKMKSSSCRREANDRKVHVAAGPRCGVVCPWINLLQRKLISMTGSGRKAGRLRCIAAHLSDIMISRPVESANR
jgi:hypothetical protein